MQASLPSRPAPHVDATFREDLSPGSVKTWVVHLGNSYSDVPASSPFYRFVETVLHQDVMGPCAATSFCPFFPVPREHMAPFVLAAHDPAFLPPACVAGAEMFADVPASSPYCRWIEELARRGVVAGCGNGAYCPTLVVARDQMSVFLTGTFALELYGP